MAGDHHAPRGGLVEAATPADERRLPGPARAHECEELTALHLEVKPLEHVDALGAARVDLVDVGYLDQHVAHSAPRALRELVGPMSRRVPSPAPAAGSARPTDPT